MRSKQAHIAVPLKRGDKVIGALCVAGRVPRTFSSAEVDLLSGLASQAAIAIENARLLSEVQRVAVLEERGRIAWELHDGLAQAFGSLLLRLRRERELLSPERLDRIRIALQEMETITESAYRDVRRSIFSLRAMIAPGPDFVPTLRTYLQAFSEESRIPVELHIAEESAIRFTLDVEMQLLRIIQEALTNVRKHAGASRAWIRFECQRGEVEVSIADDGRGYTPAEGQGKGFGLETMRERALAIGGSLKVESAPGLGTRVIARLPLAT